MTSSSVEMRGRHHEEDEGSVAEVEEPRGPSPIYLIFCILAYSMISMAVVYFNWWLFTSGFKFPVFISWLQQVVGLLLFMAGSEAARMFGALRTMFPPVSIFDPTIAKKILPLSISFVLTIATSNLCLQRTQISTYQVARSLTLLFILILSWVILKEKQTKFIVIACGLMVIGFIINSLDPATLSFWGLMFGAFSSLFQAFYNVMIKFTMGYVEDNSQVLLLYNVILSSILFLPIVLLAEGWTPFYASMDFTVTSPWVIWGGVFISGLLGTSLNMSQYLLIQVTTPLTFNIVGLTKSMVQSLGGIVFLGDKVTLESITGLTLSTMGSAAYTWAKVDQQRNKTALIEEEEINDVELVKRKASLDDIEAGGAKSMPASFTIGHHKADIPSNLSTPRDIQCTHSQVNINMDTPPTTYTDVTDEVHFIEPRRLSISAENI